MGIDHPAGIVKNIVPIVMAGVLGIYGLIVSVIITQAVSMPGADGANTYSTYNGYTHVRSCALILSTRQSVIVAWFSPQKCSCFVDPSVRCRSLLRSIVLGGGRNHWNLGRRWGPGLRSQGGGGSEVVLGCRRG
jgi:ATP synthase subunit C